MSPHSHSDECRSVSKRKGKVAQMGWLTEKERRAVLTCPHPTHDGTRLLWGRRRPEAKPEPGAV